ncbi:MAG TPA: glycosyltransferase family 39 protein [Caulobacteraceae bacterium]
MTAAIAAPATGARRGFDAWIDSWQNGGSRPALQLLAVFALLWWAFQLLSQASVGLHPDVVEVYAWSQHPSPGYFKHPPMNALIAWTWLRLFPITEWSMHLLAMVVGAAALFGADLIARRYLTGDKRLAALLMLMLTPFYQFHADNFSTNQVMLLTWPFATWAFLRSFQTRKIGWSALAGVLAAAAMLGKYYSVYLIGSFVVAALLHPARWRYLASPAPYTSALCGLATMAPNLYWLVTTGFQPFHYAYALHGAVSPLAILGADAGYLAGAAGYVALPVAAFLLAARPSRATLRAALRPADPDRRMLAHLLAGQVLLAPLSAPVVGFIPTSLWVMPAVFLLPTILLAPPEVTLKRLWTRRLALLVAAIAAAALAAAPAVAWVRHHIGDKDHRDAFAPASLELTQLWREAAPGRPLTIVRGDLDFAYAAAFYSPDHPDAAPGWDLSASPWVTPQRLASEGWAMICIGGDPWFAPDGCRQHAPPGAEVRDFETRTSFMGDAGKPTEVTVVIVPPASR